MKIVLSFLAIICLTFLISSCANNEKVHENLYRGMYEGAKQVQKMNNPDEKPPQDIDTPSYDQYKRERQEILKDHDQDQPNRDDQL